jgi:hypothetical protein
MISHLFSRTHFYYARLNFSLLPLQDFLSRLLILLFLIFFGLVNVKLTKLNPILHMYKKLLFHEACD